MDTANSINGTIKPGDVVMAAENNDYAYLIGEVTAIQKHGTPGHTDGTSNTTDSVHVDFTAFGYPPERMAEIESHFSELYGEAKNYDELPLDDVTMSPRMLLDISHLTSNSIEYFVGSREACESHCKPYPGATGQHSAKYWELVDRLDDNLYVYHKSLVDFDKDKIIQMAGEITSVTTTHNYMTKSYTFNEAQLDFYLRFQNPLSIVSDEWHDRSSDLSGMRITDIDYVIEDIFDREEGLEGYALVGDVGKQADDAGMDGVAQSANREIRGGDVVMSPKIQPDISHIVGRQRDYMELIDQLDDSLYRYHKTLLGLGKDEITKLAEKTAAMNYAHVFMTTEHRYEEAKLDFYLQLQDPLSVVADAWLERCAEGLSTGIHNMDYVIDEVFCNRDYKAGEIQSAEPLEPEAVVYTEPDGGVSAMYSAIAEGGLAIASQGNDFQHLSGDYENMAAQVDFYELEELSVQERLERKMSKEHRLFVAELKNLPPEAAIRKADEIAFQELALDFIRADTMHHNMAQALLNHVSPLKALYADWGQRKNTVENLIENIVNEQAEGLLSDAKTVSQTPKRFMSIDLVYFLGKVSGQVLVHHKEDWKLDERLLNKFADSPHLEDKYLAWHVCSMGTHLLAEREIFIRGTPAHNFWTEYYPDAPDMHGFFIEITGREGDKIIGNVFEAGDYAEHVNHVRRYAEPIDVVALSYSDAWGVNAGRTVTVGLKEYDIDRHNLMNECGNVEKIYYHAANNKKLAEGLKQERAGRMTLPAGIPEYAILHLTDKLSEIRKPIEQLSSETDKTTESTATATATVSRKPKSLAEKIQAASEKVKTQDAKSKDAKFNDAKLNVAKGSDKKSNEYEER